MTVDPGSDRTHTIREVTMASFESSKKSPWFRFAAYTDTPYMKDGYFKCGLSHLTMQHEDPRASLLLLGKRQLPPSIEGTSSTAGSSAIDHGAILSAKGKKRRQDLLSLLQKKKPEKGTKDNDSNPRFVVHFISNSMMKEDSPGIWQRESLEDLYRNELRPVLAKDLNFGNEDKVYGAGEIVKQVLRHGEASHILLVGHYVQKGLNALFHVPIAGISFFSNTESKEVLYISLGVVNSGSYTSLFGNHHDSRPWRGRGIFSFLVWACQKLHRSMCHHEGELLTVTTLTDNWTNYGAFKKMGFHPVAPNFKDVFGFPQYGDQQVVVGEEEYVPFLAEGFVYGMKGR